MTQKQYMIGILECIVYHQGDRTKSLSRSSESTLIA